jgi:fumarylacetoacetate (FAA) hydrolase family protein
MAGKANKKSHKNDVVTKAATAEIPTAPVVVEIPDELLKMVSGLAEQVTTLTKQNKKLQRAVDSLGSLPDPSEAPFKGLAQKMATPAAVKSIASAAEQTQAMMMRELEEQFRTSPDPAQREAAWKAIVKMRGL